MWGRAGFTRLVDLLSATIFSVITLVASAQIVNRYVFGSSFVFAEEKAVQLMIWMAFLGAAKCVADDSHTRLSVVVEKLPPRPKLAALVASNVLCMGFLGVAAWYGFKLVATTWRGRTIGTQVPEGLVYLAMPLCSVIMILLLADNSTDKLRRHGRKDTGAP
jgi:TRAP-type C4-dicarboxylate transport system permease small subunit